MEGSTPTSEAQELIKVLEGINTLNIYCVRFYPTNSNPFNVMTKNMKKIALAIINKTNKTDFKPGELNVIFEKIKTHLPDNIGPEKRKIIEDVVGNFVNEGGKVEIIKNAPFLIKKIIITLLHLISGIGALFAVCGGAVYFIFGYNLFMKNIIYIIGGFLIFSIYLHFINNAYLKLQEKSIDIIPETFIRKLFKHIFLFLILLLFGFLIVIYL